MTGILIRRETSEDTETHSQGKKPCEDGDKNWRDEATIYGLPGATRRLEEAGKKSSPVPAGAAWLC